MKLTGNSRGVQAVILALLLLTLWFGCSRADAQPVFYASGGQMLMSTTPIASGLHIGLESGPWQASIVTHGETILARDGAKYVLDPNLGACGTWHVPRGRWSMGWGACLFEHGDWAVGDAGPIGYDAAADALTLDDDGVQLTAAIVIRRTLGAREHVFVELFHSSTGGSTHYNRGRNLVSVGARF